MIQTGESNRPKRLYEVFLPVERNNKLDAVINKLNRGIDVEFDWAFPNPAPASGWSGGHTVTVLKLVRFESGTMVMAQRSSPTIVWTIWKMIRVRLEHSVRYKRLLDQ